MGWTVLGFSLVWKHFSLQPKDSFVQPAPLKRENFFWRVTDSDIPCPESRAFPRCSQAIFATLSQLSETSFCAESVWLSSSQEQWRLQCRAIKGTIFRPYFNLIQHRQWDTGPEGSQTKGMLAGTESRQVGQEKDKEITLCGKKEAHRGRFTLLPKVPKTEDVELLAKNWALCVLWGLTKKNERREESTTTSKKRLGQRAPGELVKNILHFLCPS